MAEYTLMSLEGMVEERERFEATLRSSVETGDVELAKMAQHLMLAGGKRLRPMFALASGWNGAGVPSATAVVLGAVACELVHIGSLYHDDVMDESSTRRGVETANVLWGNRNAIVAGDFLLARASELAADVGGEAPRILAQTIKKLCEGQAEELRTVGAVDRSVDSYLKSIKGKTASLFAAAARLGAVGGGREAEEIEAATEVGESFGMVFQIADDVLDLVATAVELGKPVGHDMMEGVYTLPVLLTLQGGGGESLRTLLEHGLLPDKADAAVRIVRAGGGIIEAVAMAEKFADRAEQAGRTLAKTPANNALVGAARELVEDLQKRI